MQGVVIKRVVAKASTSVIKEIPSKALHTYLIPPAAFLSHTPLRATPSTSPNAAVEPCSQTASLPAKRLRRARLFHRLRVLCASTITSLPIAIVKTVLAHGAQQLTSAAQLGGFNGIAIAALATGVANKSIRRWHAARRSARRGVVPVNMGPAAELSVCTFNIRGIMDRWPERAPMLKSCLKQADADVFCFQEVLTGEFGQDMQLLGPDYQVYECRAALSNLRSASIAGAVFASTVQALLSAEWSRSLLISLPSSIEGWRESNAHKGNWSNLLSKISVAPFFGNSIATRIPAVQPSPPALTPNSSSHNSSRNSRKSSSSTTSKGVSDGDILVLGDYRAAQRICFALQLHSALDSRSDSNNQQQQQQEEGPAAVGQSSRGSHPSTVPTDEVAYVWLVNTHLDHADPDVRSRQMTAILLWMEPLKQNSAAIVLSGDLNAHPGEDVHQMLSQNGYFSTHKAVHGSEPVYTWPSGIQAPLMDADEPPYCADYIYAWQAPQYQLQVTAAQLCGNQPAAEDQTLFPSDHFGIKWRLATWVWGLGAGAIPTGHFWLNGGLLGSIILAAIACVVGQLS